MTLLRVIYGSIFRGLCITTFIDFSELPDPLLLRLAGGTGGILLDMTKAWVEEFRLENDWPPAETGGAEYYFCC